MSEGQDIPHAVAVQRLRVLKDSLDQAAKSTAELGAVQAIKSAGSMRRGNAMVHDAELVTTWAWPRPEKPTPADDPLYRVLVRLVSNPPDDAPSSLFAQPEPKHTGPRPLLALRGLAPGFLAACFELGDMPLQIYRGPREHFGWLQLMRTGPADFGREFLIAWKARYSIPHECRASVDGKLVDAGGRPVATPTEESCFAACGLDFVAPPDRERVAKRMEAARSRDRSWSLR